MPVQVSELRFCYRIIEPMTAIFERLASFHRRKDSSITIPDFKYRLERTNSRIVQRDMQRLRILGTWNVKLSGVSVYHVPR